MHLMLFSMLKINRVPNSLNGKPALVDLSRSFMVRIRLSATGTLASDALDLYFMPASSMLPWLASNPDSLSQ